MIIVCVNYVFLFQNLMDDITMDLSRFGTKQFGLFSENPFPRNIALGIDHTFFGAC